MASSTGTGAAAASARARSQGPAPCQRLAKLLTQTFKLAQAEQGEGKGVSPFNACGPEPCQGPPCLEPPSLLAQHTAISDFPRRKTPLAGLLSTAQTTA